MHQPSHLWSPYISPKQTSQTRQNSMKPQALNSDSHTNPQTDATNSSNAKSDTEKTTANYRPPLNQFASMEAPYLKIKIHLDDIGADSYFSRSEMAAAEQLVQLTDHSDASCATATSDGCNRRISDAKDVDDRSEISSSCSAVRMKIEEIFGRFDEDDDHCGDREENRLKKYRSLAEIYKTTRPLIKNQSDLLPKGSMMKKVRYS